MRHIEEGDVVCFNTTRRAYIRDDIVDSTFKVKDMLSDGRANCVTLDGELKGSLFVIPLDRLELHRPNIVMLTDKELQERGIKV